MTEVPEHLLRRSRERREALGLEPKEGGAPAAEPGAAAPAEGAQVAEAAPVPAPTGPAETAPGPATPAVPGVPPAEPVPVERPVQPGRNRIPVWAMPVLVLLPFWAVLYQGAFGERGGGAEGPAPGPAAYAKGGCGACHGARGEGISAPALADGVSKLTFPNEADHVAWVKTGSGPVKGQMYGDPNREGGQQGPASGGMPGFEGTLTEEEITAVVQYERDGL